MAASFFAVTGSAWAQTDVTSTYITNPGFESCTAITANVAGGDNTTSSVDYEATGWKNTSTAKWSCSAVVAYGGSGTLAGVSAPDKDNAGNTGNALGVSVGWEGQCVYQSATSVKLPAGTYVLKAIAYNANTGATQMTSKLGFVTSSASYLSTKTSFAASTWETDVVEFILDEETTGVFQIGGAAVNAGSGSNAKVFFDNLTLTYKEAVDENYVIKNGTYYLYDKEAGVFFSRGCAWGTEASADKYGIPLNLSYADGAYTFNPYDWTGVYVNGSDGVYTDKTASFSWTPVAKGGGYVFKTSGGKYMSHASGSYGEYVTLKDADTYATVWTVMSKADRDAIVNAYPADNAKAVATAASISTDDLTATLGSYVSSVVKTIAPTDYTWTKVARADATTENPREVYQCVGNFTYSVTGLEQGIYKVSINALERDGSNADNVTYANAGYCITTSYLKANDQQVRIKGWAEDRAGDMNPNSISDAKTLFDADKYKSEVYVYVGTDGKLDLTVAVPSYVPAHWFIMGNTVITYYKDGVSEEESNKLIVSAKTLAESTMNKDVKSALNTAATNLEGNRTSKDLYQKLSDAITAANNSVDAYAAAKTELDKRKTTIDNLNSNLYTEDAYATYYTTPLAKYNDCSLTDTEAKALPEATAWHASLQLNAFLGSTFGVKSYDGVPYINTWSTEGNKDGSNFNTPFYEYWNDDNFSLGDKTLTATVTGLEAGKYAVTAWVRARLNNSATAPVSGITFKANDGEAATITGTNVPNSRLYLDEYTVYGTVGSDGTLKIVFDVASTNASWLSFKNVNYVKVSSATLTEDTGVTPLTGLAGKPVDVSFTRNFTQGVSSTVCLPYEVTPETSVGKFYAFKGVTEKDGEYTVTMSEESSTLAANTPYLFVPAATGDVTFTGTVAEAAATYTPTDVTEGEWTFVGTYSKVTYDAEDKWGDYAAIYGFVAKNLDEAQTFKAGEFVKMKKPGSSYTPAFRAVMKYKQATDGGADANVRRSVTIPSSLNVVLENEDGTTTAIGTVDVDTDYADGAWYTIDGRKIQGKPTAKGIYINGGQKVLIK